MEQIDVIKNLITDTTIIRDKVEKDTATEQYYDSIVHALHIDHFPLIVVNTIEKKTYTIEIDGKYYLIFDRYLIETMHLLNQCVLEEDQQKVVELLFYKLASEECYNQCKYSSAEVFAGKYLNMFEDVIKLYSSKNAIPNYLFVQQAFLIAHEIFHFYIHNNPSDQIRGMLAKEAFLQRICDYTEKEDANAAFYMADVIKDKNMVEECLCDSTAVIQTMDVASKTEKLSHLEAGIAMVVALMNQFTISVIQDTIKFSGDISYERIQNLYNFRLLHLKEIIFLYLKQYVSKEICANYQQRVEEVHNMWLKRVMEPIMIFLVKYHSLLEDNDNMQKDSADQKKIASFLKSVFLT